MKRFPRYDGATREDPIATIKDVARLAGVSYTTVSHVINRTRKVAPETIERVESAIAELRFRPSARARSLRTGTSGIIGLLTSSGQDIYFGEIQRGMEEACRDAGLVLIVSHSECDPELEVKNIQMLIEKDVDVLVLNNFMGNSEAQSILKAAGIPLVILQARIPALKAEFIGADDLGGARMAVEYLIRLGHRRIACIGGHSPSHHEVTDRRKGWTMALEAAGIPVEESYFAYGDYSLEGSYQCALALLDLPTPPTGIFCYSDIMAMGALRAAADRGVPVPEKLSVIGFDDIEISAYMHPRLSTVAQSKRELGRLVVERSIALKQGTSEPGQITLPVKLVSRESTGPAPRS